MFVTLDNTIPKVTLTSPANSYSVTNNPQIVVQGSVDDKAFVEHPDTNVVKLWVNSRPAQVLSLGSIGNFSQPVTLDSNISNTIKVTATDNAGNTGNSGVKTVVVDTVPPILHVGLSQPADSINISLTCSNEMLGSARAVVHSTNPAVPDATINLTESFAGVDVWTGVYGDSSHPVASGDYVVTVTGTDKAGNSATVTANFTKDTVTLDSTHTSQTVDNAATTLQIDATNNFSGSINGGISVTQDIENTAGVATPSDNNLGAAFVNVNAPDDLRDAVVFGNVSVTLTVRYDPDVLSRSNINENTLKLYVMNHTTGQWEDCSDTSPYPTGNNFVRDTVSHTLTAIVPHLSTYGVFGSVTHTLNIAKVGNGTVTPAPGTHTYNDGEIVQLTAAADPGWTFSGWSGSLTGTTSPTNITMDGDKSVTATFTQDAYTLTVNVSPVGGGSVTKAPDQTTYHYGDVVQLTANTASGYTFSSWTGVDTSNGNSATVTMNGNKTVTANFTQNQNAYTLTVNISPAGGGSVTKFPDKATYNDGEVVQLTAYANSGYFFNGWSGDLTSINTSESITMNGNKTVTATFVQNGYMLTVNISPAGSGSVSKYPDQATYNSGDTVQLTAYPNSGYNFSGWNGVDYSNGSTATVTINGNKTVTATFTYVGIVGGGGGGGGTTMGQLYLSGFSSSTPLDIDIYGYIQATAKLTTQDGKVTLDIANQTRMLSNSGSALSMMTVGNTISPPAPPAGNAVVMAYTFGPDGATFNPAMTLTMTYDPSKLPKDVAEKDLYIAYYDGKQWQSIESTIDAQAKTVSAKITHFSNYDLMGKIVATTPAPPPSTQKPTTPPTVTSSPTQIAPPTTAPPIQALAATPAPTPEKPAQPFNWTIVIIIVVAIIVILAVVLTILRRRDSGMGGRF